MRLVEVIDYAKTEGGLFERWTDEQIEAHFAAHAHHGSLLVVENEGTLAGLAIFRRLDCEPEELHNVFWEPEPEEGDLVYIHELCCTQPGAAGVMLARFAEIHTDYEDLIYIAHRRGKERAYTFDQLVRIVEAL